MSWTTVCSLSDIPPNAGAAARVDGKQVAIFRFGDEVFAIDNFDPCSGANVLSRGIIGSIGDELVVASPIYKQHFVLATGICLEDADKSVNAYHVRIEDNCVQLSLVERQAA